MTSRVRRSLAASCALFLLAGAAPPAFAESEAMHSVVRDSEKVSPTVDVLLLRPIALVTLIAGSALFVATLPIVALSRPTQIGVPFDRLVVAPARYLWVDPLGSH